MLKDSIYEKLKSLESSETQDFDVEEKCLKLNEELSLLNLEYLSEMVAKCQKKMREYAYKQLRMAISEDAINVANMEHDSTKEAQSSVSQRDIQRVFTFCRWLHDLYWIFKQERQGSDYTRRALLVSIGVVYYMRLNLKLREEFSEFIDRNYRSSCKVTFSQALEDELKWFMSKIDLPNGIAKTQALMENIFATIICTNTRTPLIMVGAPGSSKTLSFNITIANLKGQESKMITFRKTRVFKSLDPHFYQCSRRTTSNEIQTVFSRAINRQQIHSQFSLPINCVVFMDEAGLPEESHESLKVLHYHLDRQLVSFVAITNHMLDAAKSNRAVCLFRPDATDEDLTALAKGCLTSEVANPPKRIKKILKKVVKSCEAFTKLMEDDNFSHFFGLRDFVHFISYLRRKKDMKIERCVVEAIERNFNGYDNFESVFTLFLHEVSVFIFIHSSSITLL